MEKNTDSIDIVESWRARARLFNERGIQAHIKTVDGTVLGGAILRVFTDSFDIQDRKKGEYPVMFSEIFKFDKLKLELNEDNNSEIAVATSDAYNSKTKRERGISGADKP